MTQTDDTRVEVIGELCIKAERMALKLYGLISENQDNYHYAANLRFKRPENHNGNDFVVTLGYVNAYARYRPLAREVDGKVSVVGRYEVFIIEKTPFEGEKLAAKEIAHIDVETSGHCILDGTSYSLFPRPQDFDFSVEFRQFFAGRFATYMQNSLFN